MRPVRTLNYGLHGAEVESGNPVMSIWLTRVVVGLRARGEKRPSRLIYDNWGMVSEGKRKKEWRALLLHCNKSNIVGAYARASDLYEFCRKKTGTPKPPGCDGGGGRGGNGIWDEIIIIAIIDASQ